MTNLQEKVKAYINDNALGNDIMYGEVEGGCGFTFQTVDSYGGEDQGSDYWNVEKVTHEDFPGEFVFVKAYGWYQSYDGADYSGWEFVTPRQKTITVYE